MLQIKIQGDIKMSLTVRSLAASLALAASVSAQALPARAETNLKAQGLEVKKVTNIPRDFYRLSSGTYEVKGNVEKPCHVTVIEVPGYPLAAIKDTHVVTDCKFK